MKLEEILIIDGYNIIGAWPRLRKLKKLSLALARDELIQMMADYQAYSGRKVYIVFDAHQVPGKGRNELDQRVEIIYSKQNETADEAIERFVHEMVRLRRNIYVATNDLVERKVIFGQGALRVSAPELMSEVEVNRSLIKQTLNDLPTSKNRISENISRELLKKLEKWRRET